ncbi:MAG: tetratricopeptide repeat protein [Gammaproteobacteria bacterium]|nr:tetratricopeptide repeat protein [Gammaproteobacteria bacterium]
MVRNNTDWITPAAVALFAVAVAGNAVAENVADSKNAVDPVTESEWKLTQDISPESTPVEAQNTANVDPQLHHEISTAAENSGEQMHSVAAVEDSQNGAQPDLEQAEEAINTRAVEIGKSQLERDLEQQYLQLRKTLETEDSFSPKLAEDYYGYGSLLRQAARYDEALEAFTDALHIEKINNGIYSLEQRPSLKAMFETHYALGNTEEYEDLLERILWIESQNPEVKDDLMLDILLMVGNQYIDEFLRRPIAGQASVQTLLRAKHHLISAVRRYKHIPLQVSLLPYGELALISFLESRVQPDVDKTASMEDPRLKSSRNLSGRVYTLSSYFEHSFERGEVYLKGYLAKAQAEQDIVHVFHALTGLGDYNQLFKNHKVAEQYYQLAWLSAQELNAEQAPRAEFSRPVPLPEFQYAFARQPVIPTRSSLLVPLELTVGKDGTVKKVAELAPDDEFAKYFSKARRMARRLIFRPRLVDGKAVETDQVEHKIRIYVPR